MRAANFGIILVSLAVAPGCREKYAARCAHECKANGRCTGEGAEKCIATSEDDCGRAEACAAKGACGLSTSTCTVTAAGCRASADCRNLGLCSLRGDRCVAATREDCLHTEACERNARCTPQNAECVPTKEDCARTRDCTQFGKCTAVDYTCTTVTTADCSNSALCREQGYCTFQNGTCALVSDDDCKKTRACKADGLCYFQALGGDRGMLPQEACVKKREKR